jgi:DNA-binding response OmpR family regulator
MSYFIVSHRFEPKLRAGKWGSPMQRLDGRTILVAEDEPLVGLDIADTLQAAGAKIVRALKLEDAVNLARTAELSAAILDINLVGEDCLPVCQLLADRNIPFVFNTGYSERPVLEKWPDAPHLKKPSTPKEIVKAVASVLKDS